MTVANTSIGQTSGQSPRGADETAIIGEDTDLNYAIVSQSYGLNINSKNTTGVKHSFLSPKRQVAANGGRSV
jgi:hypothetical protein